jgi:hypothetical protein
MLELCRGGGEFCTGKLCVHDGRPSGLFICSCVYYPASRRKKGPRYQPLSTPTAIPQFFSFLSSQTRSQANAHHLVDMSLAMDRCIAWHDTPVDSRRGRHRPRCWDLESENFRAFRKGATTYGVHSSSFNCSSNTREATRPCVVQPCAQNTEINWLSSILLLMASSACTSLPFPAGNVHELPVKVLEARLRERPS